MSAPRVEFYFDYGSPAAYLASTQLPGICAGAGAELVYRPILLGGVFQATGNRSPAEVPAKGRYMMADLRRHAERYGVPFRANPFFPVNTLSLMRGAVGLQMRQPGRLAAYSQAVYEALWVHRQDMGDPAVVAAVVAAAGFEPQGLTALAGQPEVKEQLKANTADAVARGVFGAPTFFVGEQMFWGQDRLDFVRDTLASSSLPISTPSRSPS